MRSTTPPPLHGRAGSFCCAAWEGLYPGEGIALLPHRLVAYQGDMKYDYRTDTYSGDPLPESEATLMVYFDQTVGGIPVICGAAESFTRYAGT